MAVNPWPQDEIETQSPRARILIGGALLGPTIVGVATTLYLSFNPVKDSGLYAVAYMAFAMQFVLLFLMVSPNPLTWWSVWLGTSIKVNGKRLPDGTKVEDIQAWLGECVKGAYLKENATQYRFLRKRDAAMFKLTWG